MQPSSLVFLVIIGVWAAYFVQYWVRRRDHLATVHAADQFSESMRVLERQSAQAPADSAPRPSRPQTLLKPTATTTARVERDAAPAPAVPVAATVRRGGGRRTRGLAVLVTGAALLVTVPLVVMGMVPPAAVAALGVALVAALVWVRQGVAAERAARRAGQRADRPRPQRQPEAPVATATPIASQPPAAIEESQPEPHPQRMRDELYDVQQVEQSYAPPVVEAPEPERMTPLVDDDDIPLTWDPVPVPRPTYAMKSRVSRPAPTAADLVGDADTEYAAYEDEAPARRVAGA